MSYLRAARRVLPQVAGLRQMSGATGVKKNFYVEVRRLCVRESCVARRVRSRRSRSKSLPRNTVPWLPSRSLTPHPPSLSLSSTRPQEWDGVRGDVYKEWTFAPKNVASAFFFLIVIPGAIFATATSQQHVRSLTLRFVFVLFSFLSPTLPSSRFRAVRPCAHLFCCRLRTR